MIRIDATRREIVFAAEQRPTLRLPLISGHACPNCWKVLRAGFETPQPVALHPYEEAPALTAETSLYEIGFDRRMQVIMLGEREASSRGWSGSRRK